MEPDLQSDYRRPQPAPYFNLTGRVLAIALGTFIGVFGTAMAFYHYWKWDVSRQFQAAASQARSALADRREWQAARDERDAALRRRQARERREHQATIDQAGRTCNFWRREYADDPTSKARLYRDTACNRLESLR